MSKSKQYDDQTAKLRAFIVDKVKQWEPVLHLVPLVNNGLPAVYLRVQEMLDADSSLDSIISSLKEDKRLGGGTYAHLDILAVIEKSTPFLPADIHAIPQFIQGEERRRGEELRRKIAAQREDAEKERLRRIEEEKKQKRMELAADLGIRPEALEKLAEGNIEDPADRPLKESELPKGEA